MNNPHNVNGKTTSCANKINRKTHYLKILPDYFEAVRLRQKTFEIRHNDRDFQVGDHVCLQEYDGDSLMDNSDGFTGRHLTFQIAYITDYMQFDGFVVFSLLPITEVGDQL